MGSLTSRPKIPKPQPRIIYVPAPQPHITAPPPRRSTPETLQPQAPQSSGSVQENSADQPYEVAQDSQTIKEHREDNLLKRDRGRFGTVNTSFRGLLELARSNDQSRKTLLGE